VQINLRAAWLQFSSCVVAGAFVFANSIRTIYESVVFLFVVHPFDVGDGIFIGSQTDFYIVRTRLHALPTALTT
jgi:small-conductance mechanosensitive channel